MTKLIKSKIFFGLILVVFGIFSYSALTGLAEASQPGNFLTGELLVKFKNSDEILRLKVDQQLDLAPLIERYQNFPEVEYIEPNYLLAVAAFPDDPEYPKQQYLQMVNIRSAWSKELLIRESERITKRSVIAILDTGVDLDHPDLKDKIWTNINERKGDGVDNDQNGYVDDINGWDFVSSDADPNPALTNGYELGAINHGTIVAGIAAASINNSEGIAGISWFSEVMPLRILDSTGSGDIFSAVKAIDYAINAGADVINMSFIGQNQSQSLDAAIKRAYDRGVIIVAAAGNTDPNIDGVNLDLTEYYPVCSDGSGGENMVIGVAAIDQTFKKSKFSNYGKCVDIVAPGEKFYSTQVYDATQASLKSYYNGYWSGTSLSTPLVSGTAAIIKALRPQFSAKMIRDSILNSTQNIDIYNPGFQGKLGSGQLDIDGALEAALGESRGANAGFGKQAYLVAGLGLGSFPQLKILKTDGSEFKSFYAYSPNFSGVINVATGDVTGDKIQDIVTGAGNGGGPHVRVFDQEGHVLGQFFAYDQVFRGGVNVAVGDVNEDGVAEIVTGSGKGARPEVKVFDFRGKLLQSFLAYDQNFTGGVKVAVGDINGDGLAEIVTGAGTGGGPHVRIFDSAGTVLSQFFAYNQTFTGGVNVAVGDIFGDGQFKIIVSPQKNATPTVRVFNRQGTQLANFFAFEPNYFAGVELAAGDIDNDGIDEIIAGRSVSGNSELKVFNYAGELKSVLTGHDVKYKGGVRPAVIIL
ncbi:MAG: hypothetical protein A2744_02310 [Candidatus Buchananbacteria bacterium RIFCSPHIGHO2_01_FULL_44_11]|uniref:Peptidase S8/S53 domain-containing protein n=1 Tax=Candidatus Buchananbacteria bacterium RIFCSPHIGHO2_01_FULL_44_11 TaxID=1797535 RepID=A0A1G1XZJ1_9BACT|nr:MAG: hypothetical protein A2744_02310 [Candidatus Buchananbacteria bacterium RIFCSPHIGHO2_01_FULL_44_11]